MAFSKRQSSEDTYGLLSRALFLWINPYLFRGYKRALVHEDLPALDRDLKPEVTRKTILRAWSQRAKPEKRRTLPLALFKSVKAQFLAAILPRLFLICFRYSQPILIRRAITYASAHSIDVKSDYGYWLVVSAVIVYVGLAISTAAYQHSLNKLKLTIRSALVGLIHNKVMKSPSISYDDGEVTALMSTDAESLEGIGEILHETWAQVLEVVIGIFMLAHQVGRIWPLPLVLVYLCSHMSRFVAKQLSPRQKDRNIATQNRVAATSSMLSCMKTVKMLGLQGYLADRLLELREAELFAASKLRWITIYYNASANALGIFSPALTLVIFAVISGAGGRKLDTETAFTTMAILSMVTHPANMVMTIVPRAVASFAGFDRIQAFLLQPSLHAGRGTLRKKPSIAALGAEKLTESAPAILIRQLNIGSSPAILENVNMKLAAGSITVISGPTGSGKSTLLRAILGEVVPTSGSLDLSTPKIGYCAQKPWLPSGRIREVIQGPILEDNDQWYQEVVNMCGLGHDFDALPEGDQTQVGSRGLNLSGGQRQRVALARTLFAGNKIVLLDDTFSGLDGETESRIFDNLFGRTGLFRRLHITVLLVSNSTQYFQAADQVVVLGDRGIVEQGIWQSLKTQSSSIAKFTSAHQDNTREPASSAGFDKLGAQVQAKNEAQVDLARQAGDFTLYSYYYQFMGLLNLVLLVACSSSHAFFITMPQYWLQLWTESMGGDSFYICGFLFLSLMSWSSTNGIKWSHVIRLAPDTGKRIHARLLHIVADAPLSYFSKTDNGAILNRFTQDTHIIDEQLPLAISNLACQITKLIMQISLLFLAQRHFTLFLPPCILIIYIVQKIYLRTSRQLRFLELEARASVFSNILETIEGLETLRSFHWTIPTIHASTHTLSLAQRPEFLLLCLQRWLNIVLDLLAAAVATGLIATAVGMRGVSGAQVGMGLNVMLVANSTLLKLVENWTAVEVGMGAVARLRSLETSTPAEDAGAEGFEVPEKWLMEGRVRFEGVTAGYDSQTPALKNINLHISPGQKLIISGRTGSGKSTLLLTLLRLLDLQSGEITLDGLNIQTIPLKLLREKCFLTIPQDALILPTETLRFNLDPSLSAPSKSIFEALRKTGLWAHFLPGLEQVPNIAKRNALSKILDHKLASLSSLSVGQCQLFALCRALIKASSLREAGGKPVVLLDEVTSSLDAATESAIYKLIDEEFSEKGYTVIIVAHRIGGLEAFMKRGRDVVVEMRDGRVVEVRGGLTMKGLEGGE